MSDPTRIDLPEAVTSRPLHLTVDPWWDTLHCLAFGTVSDGLPRIPAADRRQRRSGDLGRTAFRGAAPRSRRCQRRPDHPRGPSAVRRRPDSRRDAPPHRPRRQVPTGRAAALGARAGRGRHARALRLGLHADGRRPPEPCYAHLRRYTELAPANAWAWCWLGQCCEALGRNSEARAAYQQAVAAEELCGLETDSAERLEQLRR